MIEAVNQIVMKRINEIKPYVRNPRQNDKTVDLLVEIIPKVGFNVPIVIDHDGVIVKGHSRYKAAIRLGMEEVPCVVTDADEEAIKLDRIADNKVSEFSEWLDEELLHEVDMINIDFDFGELGIEVPQFNMDFSMPDFTDDEDEQDTAAADEERRRRFLEMQANAPTVEFATEKSVARAEKKVQDVVRKEKLYKSVCEKCGHIQFVRPQDAIEVDAE